MTLLLLLLLILLTVPQEPDPFVTLRWALTGIAVCLIVMLVLIAAMMWVSRSRKFWVMLGIVVLGTLNTVAQQQPKRFQCKVDTDGESIKLVQCQHEDEEDMIEGGFNFLNFPDKWKPALSHAQPGEGTAHFTETAKEICLRQVRPLDGFLRHPANEDLNLCQRKSKGWRVSNSRLGG